MTNFDFLLNEKKFASFAGAAVTAEKSLSKEDPGGSATACRRAMEIAVKWMYSVDSDLETPVDEGLHSLINDGVFVKIKKGSIIFIEPFLITHCKVL